MVSSALMGSINGSAVANVVTTGTFTIPLMKTVGYKPDYAGAVEAVASSWQSTNPLSHNRKEGLKVVFTPLITDLPLLLVTASLYSRVTNLDLFLGIVSILGALFIGFLGWKNLNAKGLRFDKPNDRADSLQKGLLANLLNPYPYIFWLTVGGPVMIDSFAKGLIWGLSFIAGFYCMLAASRVVLILIVGKIVRVY